MLLFLGLAVGCASYESSYNPPVKTRDRVFINTAFDSLPNASRINFQRGRQVPYGKLDRWTTYCRLYVYNRRYDADYLTSIEPGQFEIVGVKLSHTSSNSYYPPWRSVSLWRRPHDIPAYYLYQIGLRLTSPDQSDVKSLDCYKKWSLRGYHYPSLVEIRQALGDLIELRTQP